MFVYSFSSLFCLFAVAEATPAGDNVLFDVGTLIGVVVGIIVCLLIVGIVAAVLIARQKRSGRNHRKDAAFEFQEMAALDAHDDTYFKVINRIENNVVAFSVSLCIRCCYDTNKLRH